jgi:hypothetical protein
VVGAMAIVCPIVATGGYCRDVCTSAERAARRTTGDTGNAAGCQWSTHSSLRIGGEREEAEVDLLPTQFDVTSSEQKGQGNNRCFHDFSHWASHFLNAFGTSSKSEILLTSSVLADLLHRLQDFVDVKARRLLALWEIPETL